MKGIPLLCISNALLGITSTHKPHLSTWCEEPGRLDSVMVTLSVAATSFPNPGQTKSLHPGYLVPFSYSKKLAQAVAVGVTGRPS